MDGFRSHHHHCLRLRLHGGSNIDVYIYDLNGPVDINVIPPHDRAGALAKLRDAIDHELGHANHLIHPDDLVTVKLDDGTIAGYLIDQGHGD